MIGAQPMAMKQNRPTRQRPFLDIRIGEVRLTIQRIPYRLLALAAGMAGSLGSAAWLGR